MRSSTSSPDETGSIRPLHLAALAAGAIRSAGRTYPELARYVAGDMRRFLQARTSLDGALVLDVGSGHGGSGEALDGTGAVVVSADRSPLGGPRRVAADATALPFAPGTFDGVICSNLLEHVPSPPKLVGELARILRHQGWVYLSWTAWYAPLGGHEYSPWHYLGVPAARSIGRRLHFGRGHNVPGEHLFPVHVGPTIRGIARTGAFRIQYAAPRYWPSQAWILRVPGLREVATWNCLLFLERT